MNTTELKELAEKATPGPWSHEEIDPTDPEWGACEVFTEGTDTFVATHVCRVNDAAYIAAANPAEILELIAQLEDARTQMERQKDEWLSWEAKRRDLEKAAAQLEDAQGEIRRLAQVEAEHAALLKAISDAKPVAWSAGIEWHPIKHYQSEQVQKLTRKEQKEYGFTIPLYTLEGIRTKP